MTILSHMTMATMHRRYGDVVMEDSRRELCRHLPILMVAKGRVLVTGLGLGCVVRGLLSLDEVEHVDVIELDRLIIDAIGPEFVDDPRVVIHHCDALGFKPIDERWDYAWHDLWFEDGAGPLNRAHTQLIHNLCHHVEHQGCWGMDRRISRIVPWQLLNARRRRPNILRRRNV